MANVELINQILNAYRASGVSEDRLAEMQSELQELNDAELQQKLTEALNQRGNWGNIGDSFTLNTSPLFEQPAKPQLPVLPKLSVEATIPELTEEQAQEIAMRNLWAINGHLAAAQGELDPEKLEGMQMLITAEARELYYLDKARSPEGLTFKEYLEGMKNDLRVMLLRKYPNLGNDNSALEQRLDAMSPEDIKNVQQALIKHEFGILDDDSVREILSGATEITENYTVVQYEKEYKGTRKRIKPPYQYSQNPEELIKFDELYKTFRGTDFNPATIRQYLIDGTVTFYENPFENGFPSLEDLEKHTGYVNNFSASYISSFGQPYRAEYLKVLQNSDFDSSAAYGVHPVRLDKTLHPSESGMEFVIPTEDLTQDTVERELNEKELKRFSANMLYNILNTTYNMFKGYYDGAWEQLKSGSVGTAAVQGFLGFGEMLSGQDLTVRSQMDKVGDLLAKATQLKNMDDNAFEQHFDEMFAEISGTSFDIVAMQNFAQLTMKGIKTDTKQYDEAVTRAFGSNRTGDAETQFSILNPINGVVDIVAFLAGSEVLGETKLFSLLGKKSLQLTSKAATKFGFDLTSKGVQTGVRLIAGSPVSAANMMTYTALTEIGGTALYYGAESADMIRPDHGEYMSVMDPDFVSRYPSFFEGDSDLLRITVDLVKQGAMGSVAPFIGAFANKAGRGLATAFSKGNPTAIQKSFSAFSKAEAKTVSAQTLMSDYLSALDVPALTRAQRVIETSGAFLTEVAGFTGYSTLEHIAEGLITGELDLDSIDLGEEFQGQLEGLATLKGVARFIQMKKSGSVARGVQDKSMADMTEHLKNYEIREIDGKYQVINKNEGKLQTFDKPEEVINHLFSQMFFESAAARYTEEVASAGAEPDPYLENPELSSDSELPAGQSRAKVKEGGNITAPKGAKIIGEGNNKAVYDEIESLVGEQEAPLESNNPGAQFNVAKNFNVENYRKKLAGMTVVKDESLKPQQRFSAEEISTLTALKQKYGDIVDKYINKTVTIEGIEIPVYGTADEVVKMVNLSKQHKMLTASLSKLTAKGVDSNGKEIEFPMLGADAIESIIKAWEIDSKLTNELLKNLGKMDGNTYLPLSAPDEILAVAEAYKINPELTRELIDFRNEYYEAEDGSMRTKLSAEDKALVEKGEHPNNLKKHSEAKFYGDQIKMLVELNAQNPKIIELFKSEFSGNGVQEFRDAYYGNKDFVDKLLNEAETLGIDHLNDYYVTELAKYQKNSPELTTELLSRTFSFEGEPYKMAAHEIVEILKVTNPDNVDVISKTLDNYTQIKGMRYGAESRFYAKDIAKIAEVTTKENKEVVLKALERKGYYNDTVYGQDESGNYTKETKQVETYAYGADDIVNLARMAKINKDAVLEAVSNDNAFEFTGWSNESLKYADTKDIFMQVVEKQFGTDSDFTALVRDNLSNEQYGNDNFKILLDMFDGGTIDTRAHELRSLISQGAKFDPNTGRPLPEIPQELKDMITRNPEDAVHDSQTGENIEGKIREYLQAQRAEQDSMPQSERLAQYKAEVEEKLLNEKFNQLIDFCKNDPELKTTLENMRDSFNGPEDIYKIINTFNTIKFDPATGEKISDSRKLAIFKDSITKEYSQRKAAPETSKPEENRFSDDDNKMLKEFDQNDVQQLASEKVTDRNGVESYKYNADQIAAMLKIKATNTELFNIIKNVQCKDEKGNEEFAHTASELENINKIAQMGEEGLKLAKLLCSEVTPVGEGIQLKYHELLPEIEMLCATYSPEILLDGLQRHQFTTEDDLGKYGYAAKHYDSKLVDKLLTDGFSIDHTVKLLLDRSTSYIENMLNGIESAKASNNIDSKKLEYQDEGYGMMLGDDKFTRFADEKGNIYKVDKETGEVINLTIASNSDSGKVKTVNLKTGETTEVTIHTSRKQNPLASGEDSKYHNVPDYIDVVYKSADGKEISHERMIESKVKGNYEIYAYIEGADGVVRKDLIGLAEYDGNGGTHIEKNVESLNGTKTQTVYADDAQGNRFSQYRVTDPNGKLLYETSETFKKISEDHYQTTSRTKGDGIETVEERFDIQYFDDKVVITKLDANNKPTEEKIEYKIKDFTAEDYNKFYEEMSEKLKEFNEKMENLAMLGGLTRKDIGGLDIDAVMRDQNIQDYTIDRKLIPTMKNLSGTEYFNLFGQTKILIGELPENGNAMSLDGGIAVSKEQYAHLSTLLHEAGHENTHKLSLTQDQELNEIYEREKQAFIAQFPDAAIGTISYFLADNEVFYENKNNALVKVEMMRGLDETTAEGKLITKYKSQWDFTQDRTAMLQQFFPETIACIGRKTSAKKGVVSDPVTTDNAALPKELTKNVNKRLKSFGMEKVFTAEELLTDSRDVARQVGVDKEGNPVYELTEKGQELVWRAARQIRQAALANEPNIIEFMRQLGLTSDKSAFTDKEGNMIDIAHRAKSDQSIHDKLQNIMLRAVRKNNDVSLAQAISEVNDGVGTRTAILMENYADKPDVKAAIEKGDMKNAIMLAVEHESSAVYEALEKYIDSVADGTNKVEIIRIANYIGEDGIPYFTERQLNRLKAYADSKGVSIPFIERVNTLAERQAAAKTEDDRYNPDASTQIRGSGYTALQMNFVDKATGFVYEWQFRGQLVNEFAEGEHVPYDLRTGKDIIGDNEALKGLYEPMKKILDKETMSDTDYKEYENYLTSYYEYLRLAELGFNDGKNPPKLPAKFDARLRAENLMLLHEYSDKVKKDPDNADALTKEYESKLIQNTPENTTTESYTAKAEAKKNDRVLDRYEASRRVGENNGIESDGKYSSIVVKACRDNGTGQIRENLINEAEKLQLMNIDDKVIAKLITKAKNGDIKSIDEHIKKFKETHPEFSEQEIAGFLEIAMDGEGKYNTIKMTDIAVFYKNAPVDYEVLAHIFEKIDASTDRNVASDIRGAAKVLCQTFNASSLGDMKNNQSLMSIFDSCFDKSGKIDVDSFEVANSLLKSKVNFSDIPKILALAKNSNDGKVYDAKGIILGILKKTDNFVNSGYPQSGSNSYILMEILKSLRKSVKTPFGWVAGVSRDNVKWFNAVATNIQSLPGETYLMKMNRVSQILTGAKTNSGAVSQLLVNIGVRLANNKYTPNTIKEVLHLMASGKMPDAGKKVDDMNKRYPVDMHKVKWVDIAIEDGLIKRTIVSLDNTVHIEDFDLQTLEKRGDYDYKSGANPRGKRLSLSELDDNVRGVRTRVKKRRNIPYETTTVIKDPATGETVGIEYQRESEDFEGGHDIQYRDVKNGGITKMLSQARRDEFGNLKVNKDYDSLDGTNTKFDYTENPDGSYSSTYKITDAEGKVLFNEDRTFTVLDATHCESTCNGKKYLIEISEDNVLTVRTEDNKTVSFDLDEFSGMNMNDPDFIELFRHIPGHEFFQMERVGTSKVKDANVKDNAYYAANDNSVNLGFDHKKLSTFLHEFGHNKDGRLYTDPKNDKRFQMLCMDQEIGRQYEEERSAFVQAFPSLQRDFVSYFISTDKAGDRFNKGLSEVVAETNMLLNKSVGFNSFRTEYLRRYFPKTIALIAKKLNPEIYTN